MEQLLRDICNYVLDKYGLPTVRLRFSNIQGSYIKYRSTRNGGNGYTITVATCWFRAEELGVASLLHEFAHLIQHTLYGKFDHKENFRAIEKELLADFGLRPVGYRRAYYGTLTTLNGKYQWNRNIIRG